jgi:hypothetical protein
VWEWEKKLLFWLRGRRNEAKNVEDGREGKRGFRRAASGRGKGRFSIWRHRGWFEEVNRNCVLFGTNLNEEGMRGSTEDPVRTRIGRSEGRV